MMSKVVTLGFGQGTRMRRLPFLGYPACGRHGVGEVEQGRPRHLDPVLLVRQKYSPGSKRGEADDNFLPAGARRPPGASGHGYRRRHHVHLLLLLKKGCCCCCCCCRVHTSPLLCPAPRPVRPALRHSCPAAALLQQLTQRIIRGLHHGVPRRQQRQGVVVASEHLLRASGQGGVPGRPG